MKKWVLAKGDKSRAPQIAKERNISQLAAAILALKAEDVQFNADEYLCDEASFSDPFLIRDMDKAVERINSAVENGEKICIYGDYDADGVTSTAIMYMYLKSLWCDVMYYIPARETEGYGMNDTAVEKLHSMGITLIITVDNGISAYDQVKLANSLDMDVVVTDHHAIPEKMPEAVAVIDPHRADDESPFEHFSGVGVALKLIMALEGENADVEELLDRYSAICAIGTVADIVSLTGENRTLVREGLKRINDNVNLGITVLREKSGCAEKRVTSAEIGFGLAPRINAGGRLGLSQRSVELLICEDREKAEEIADELCRDNDERKQIEKNICEQARVALDENEDIRNKKIIVVAGEGWHQGVIGLAATQIREIYGKPTIVISYEGGSAKGSARSVEGFPMNKGVAYCSDLLTIFGGHPMAAGMSLPTSNIDAFREKINEYADTLEDEFLPSIEISARLKPGLLSPEDVDSLSMFEPYGAGNAKPVFAYGGVTITDVSSLKNGMYAKVLFSKGDLYGSALCFSSTYEEFPYKKGDVVDIAVSIGVNEYNGTRSVSSVIKEIKFYGEDNEKMLRSKRAFEEYSLGKPLRKEEKQDLAADRDDFALVYKYLRANGGFKGEAVILYHRLEGKKFSFGSLLLIIKAMEQLELINCERIGERYEITLLPVAKKAQLSSAPIMSAFGVEN